MKADEIFHPGFHLFHLFSSGSPSQPIPTQPLSSLDEKIAPFFIYFFDPLPSTSDRCIANQKTTCQQTESNALFPTFVMKADIHPKYVDAEIRCACGNVIKTRSIKPSIIIGICNVCHPFYTGTQKFVDTAGRVDKFQQRLAKTQAAQAAAAEATGKKKKK
jgi:large subunit ribosomal protein L31